MLATLAVSFAEASDNPHWNADSCGTCHVSASPTPDNRVLKTEPAEHGCEECHGGVGPARRCPHGSDLSVVGRQIPQRYLDSTQERKIVCTTCHDLVEQCLKPDMAERVVNPGFLRSRKSPSTADQCFDCHDSTGLESLNPHVPLEDESPGSTCLFCHVMMPSIDAGQWSSADQELRPSLDAICKGCHSITPHPGDMFAPNATMWSHLVVPSIDTAGTLRKSEANTGIRLPLDPVTGQLHCSTCHNPHHAQSPGLPQLKLSEVKHMLRGDGICQACHEM